MSKGNYHNQENNRNRGGNHNRGKNNEPPSLDDEMIRKWIQEGINEENGNDLIKFAEVEAKRMKRNLTKTQFRNVFNELRRIEQLFTEDKKTEAIRFILKLQPKLAYLSKRIDKPEARRFKELMTKAIEFHEKEYVSRFENFMDMSEALMGYHYANAEK